MWSVFRFSLCRGGERAYRDALEILRGAGFRHAPAPEPVDADAPFPASVVADVGGSPADVTRAIFEALHAAGLRPTAVSGCAIVERLPAEHVALA